MTALVAEYHIDQKQRDVKSQPGLTFYGHTGVYLHMHHRHAEASKDGVSTYVTSSISGNEMCLGKSQLVDEDLVAYLATQLAT